MTLVSTEWLSNNLSKVKIFDSSWHMPNSNRNSQKEYLDKHIPEAMFWDLDEHSDKIRLSHICYQILIIGLECCGLLE